MSVRVRFAPSPTGYLHVGGARTALFNWLFARHHGGAFILRIEDTDAARNSWAAVEQILASMAWLGLAWDEGPLVGGPHGPYFQSGRLPKYRAALERLLAEGHAYRCWCSAEDLAATREAAKAAGTVARYPGTCRELSAAEIRARESEGRPAAVRFRVPEGETQLRDLLHGVVRVANGEMDDLVIVKSDGMPTYNFAVVVDDLDMEITHVIRGNDHLSNTPRQVLLYHALGAEPPVFVHVPQILGPDKTKLSKRHGATSVFEYRHEGITPAAMMCYLARLGWSYDDKTELFTTEELVRVFDLARLNKTAAVFDREKLDWVNARYLRAQTNEDRARLLMPALIRDGLVAPEPDGAARRKVEEVAAILGDRLKLGPGASRGLEAFFREPAAADPEVERKVYAPAGVAAWLERLAGAFAALPVYGTAEIEAALRGLAGELGVKAKDLIHPCRFAVTAETAGPGLFETLAVVGRERAVARLTRAAARARGLEANRPPAS